MRVADCSVCGAGIGSYGPVLCHRCRAAEREARRRATCPGCGRFLRLQATTGRCVRCSRVCMDCGHPVRSAGVERCRDCRRRQAAIEARATCPRCRRPGILRPATGWCGPCSRPPPPPLQPRPCQACGALARKKGEGVCNRCWTNSPTRPITQAVNLAAALEHSPEWLVDFAEFAAARHCVPRACVMVSALATLLRDGQPVHPQALLERARRPGRSEGAFARTLEAFLIGRRLAFGLDQPARLADGRRTRRVAATPEALRPAVAAFADYLVTSQQRARRAGTRARSDSTIETTLSSVRDLGRFLVAKRYKADWASVDRSDIEEFLSTRLPSAGRALGSSRLFFRWARRHKLVLTDPTAGLSVARRWTYTGRTVSIPDQRRLFKRWTTDPDVHPHEALTGLLALLHAANSTEIRYLRLHDIDHGHQTLRLGQRTRPAPIDPSTASAIGACLAHRQSLGTLNPHVIVTRVTKTRDTPCSQAYLAHILDPVGVPPRRLRETRIVDLTLSVGPKVVSEMLGMNADGVLGYLPDDVDDTRLDS